LVDLQPKIRNYQEALCKIVFNIPTFDCIFNLVGLNDFVASKKKNKFESLKKRFEKNKDKMTEEEKQDIAKQIKTLELLIGFILPDDTMSFITK